MMRLIKPRIYYVLYLVLTVTATIIALETIVRVSGYSQQWSGFGAGISSSFYRVKPGTEDDPMLETNPELARIFHKESFPLHKNADLRVFSVGGSATYGWGVPSSKENSYINVFKREFMAAFPDKRIETINAGGIGYGSFRELIEIREIVKYNPDLILVYTGNNEFWEYPIYKKRFDGRVYKTSIYDYLRKSYLYLFLRDSLIKANKELFNSTALFNGSYERFDEEKLQLVLDHFEKNITEMVELAKANKISIILSTVGANLEVNPDDVKDWLSDASFHATSLDAATLNEWQAAYDEGLRLSKAGNCGKAMESFSRAIHLSPGYARAYHELARCQEELKMFDEAYENYWKHIDWSRRLVTRDINRIILNICVREQIPCITGQAALESEAPHNITGYDLFIDSMHPSKKGHEILGKLYFNKYLSLPAAGQQ